MTKTTEQVVEKEVEITEDVAKEIAKHVQVDAPEVDYDQLAEKTAEKLAEKQEKTVEKELHKEEEQKSSATQKKLGKEMFLYEQLKAANNNDYGTLSKLNKEAKKSLVEAGIVSEKADFLNTDEGDEGGHLVPNAELVREIADVLPEHGALAGLLRTLNLQSGDTVDLPTLAGQVSVVKVGTEGGAKTHSKPVFGKKSVTVEEFAGFTLLSKRLVQQSPFDIFAIVRDGYASAMAENLDELGLTDGDSGIIEQGGVVELSIGGDSLDDFDWKSIRKAPFRVPTKSSRGGSFVLSKSLIEQAVTATDSQNRPILIPGEQGIESGTLFGYRYVMAEVLPTADAADTAYGVFGNWGRYGWHVRQGGMQSEVFNTGTVTIGQTDHNLLQENKLAVRAEWYENVGYTIPGAFVVLKTAAAYQ